MKKDIHPTNYRPVVFQDLNTGAMFLTHSTVQADDTVKHKDGNDYPLVKVHISSASHPFYTGQEKLVDVEGRVDKFKARRKAAEKAKQDKVIKNAKSSPSAEDKEEKAEAQKIG